MQHKNIASAKFILDALKVHYKFKTYGALASFLGLKQNSISTWISRGSIDRDLIYRKCDGINFKWLETGEGEMFKEKTVPGEQQAQQSQQTVPAGLQAQKGKRTVPGEPYSERWQYSVPGGRGIGEGHHKRSGDLGPINPDYFVELQVYITGGAGAPYEFIPSDPIETIVIPRSFCSNSVIPVKVRGRSMERTLRDGAIVGVNRDDRQVVNGELFAIWLPYQGTVIKRLYLDNKKIRLQSDNEEFRSSDIEVALDEVDVEHFIQGRVKWVIQML